jgi:NAD(P)-dependent dehydrogenase (short-subunit alcohol dehydrogenase family)
MNENRLLEGKVALITGTGGGQGRAAALLFAAHGARIVGCDLKVEGAEETVRMVRAQGGEMMSAQPVDLGDEVAVQAWVDFALSHYGDFDILYNNASATKFGPIESMSLDDWNFGLRNEITVQFLPTRAAIPVFRRRGGGVIINASSIIGYERGCVAPGGIVHAVAKAGVNAFTQQLAVELAPLGVRVNAIAPGAINTPPLAPLLGDPKSPFRAAQIAAQAVRRIGEPEDCAQAALFLASDQANFITGAILPVDGGLVIGGRTATVFDAFNTAGFNESETTRVVSAIAPR